MKEQRVINQTRNTELANSVIMADSFWPRLKGLLGRSGLAPGCCLVLKPCLSVHTFFMAFPIDVLFLDRDNRAVGIFNNLPPFRLTGVLRKSYLAVELPAGTLSATGTSAGDIIKITAG